MKKLVLAAAFMLVAQIAMAQDATFKTDVVKFLNVSGTTVTFEAITKDLIKNVPVEKQADFKKDLDVSIQELISKMADMYMTEFTHEDVKAMLKFYESPIGKKMSSKAAVLYDKGQAVGQEWGMGLQTIMMKYMQ